MNIPFDIGSGNGPVIFEPIRTMEQVKKVTKLNPQESCPFVGAALTQVRWPGWQAHVHMGLRARFLVGAL